MLGHYDVVKLGLQTTPELHSTSASQHSYLQLQQNVLVHCNPNPSIHIMSFLRPMSMLRSAALRPAALSAAPRARMQVRYSTQDYGSGTGNPAGETPEKQGANPSENLEHPGPAPPKVARGQSSSSPDKDDNSGQNASPKPSSESPAPSSNKGSSGKREFSTSARQMKASEEPAVQQGMQNKPSQSAIKGAKPKILNENPPSAEEESQDVKEHNKNMSNRAEQAHESVSNEEAEKDKVPSGYWKGTASPSQLWVHR
jgi:hypothetical protein